MFNVILSVILTKVKNATIVINVRFAAPVFNARLAKKCMIKKMYV